MIDAMSSPQSIKEQISALVKWGYRLPDYVFTRKGYSYAYFFESSIAGRPDLRDCLVTMLSRAFGKPVMFSIGHDDRDGRFVYDDAASTLLISGNAIDSMSSDGGSAFARYVATHPYEGLVCGTNTSMDWMLFDDPADLVGVLVAKQRIDMREAEMDYVFDLERFLQLATEPQLDFSSRFIQGIRDTYGGQRGKISDPSVS